MVTLASPRVAGIYTPDLIRSEHQEKPRSGDREPAHTVTNLYDTRDED